MTQSKCPRCEDWWEPYEEHDFQHLEERKVESLERIAAAVQRAYPEEELESSAEAQSLLDTFQLEHTG